MTSIASSEQPWPRPAVSYMVFHGNKVLLGQRSKPPLRGKWSLPGGHIEPGETVAEAGSRELMEETGVTARPIGHAGTLDVILRDDAGSLSAHYVLTVLVGVWCRGNANAASDCLAVAWVAVSELESYDLTQGTAELVRTTYAEHATYLDRSDEAR